MQSTARVANSCFHRIGLVNRGEIDINIKDSEARRCDRRSAESGGCVGEVCVHRQVVVIWDMEDEPEGNFVHFVVEHDVSQDDVDDVMSDPTNPTTESDSSGRPITFGWTQSGRHIAVVWELVSDDPCTIKPVTAYDAPPPARASGPRGKKRRRKQ